MSERCTSHTPIRIHRCTQQRFLFLHNFIYFDLYDISTEYQRDGYLEFSELFILSFKETELPRHITSESDKSSFLSQTLFTEKPLVKCVPI